MALRGGAVYLSTEAFYLEIKDNGEEILHILNPESIEILPRGGDLVAHLKGLMELKPSNWKGLSTLQDELKSILGDDLIPRVGGTPAQIRLFDNYTALSILPQNNHFVLRIRDPFPLAEEKLTELEKICGFNLFELVGPRGGYLMDLIVPDSPLFMNLPDQKHCYFLAHHLHAVSIMMLVKEMINLITLLTRVSDGC
ncbi:MED1 [Lepeophtheirus salmonis]|uniref:MED1 n=1 Tax=Lepeophtheirus salmonis TaxID=72036 RepID=A0A7R8H1M8_LEPSM|nr:MED1 [Lepeophtheirus salmonis]CAF2815051.1 MED1 [Lepeophtheirus salmonis]